MPFGSPIRIPSNAAYEAAFEKMTPGQGCVQLAVNTIFDMGVVFGPREEDRKYLTDHGMEICQHLHEGYRAGTWRPMRGSVAEYGVLMMEEIAGGKPLPSQREEIGAKLMQKLAAILSKPRNAMGQTRESPFIPLNNTDPKRKAALDQLNSIGKLRLAD